MGNGKLGKHLENAIIVVTAVARTTMEGEPNPRSRTGEQKKKRTFLPRSERPEPPGHGRIS